MAALRERQSLLLLRELLVMIRRWGAARPACLPVFHRGGEQTDVLALLFKLLTRLLALHSAEPDEALISECPPITDCWQPGSLPGASLRLLILGLSAPHQRWRPVTCR